jgi:hypothetical protein
MDTAATLRVLAHELRMPTSVIQGYVRMLREGLLDDQDRDKALTQIQHATGRLSELARDASSVAQWLTSPPNGGASNTQVATVLERALATSTVTPPPTLAIPPQLSCQIATPNAQALVAAFVRLLEAIAREVPSDETLAVEVRGVDGGGCDVMVVPASAAATLATSRPDGPGAEPVTLIRGGLGLTFLLSVAVLEAHGATLWTQSGSRGIIVRLPAKPTRSS